LLNAAKYYGVKFVERNAFNELFIDDEGFNESSGSQINSNQNRIEVLSS
jgi:hypothetical protein